MFFTFYFLMFFSFYYCYYFFSFFSYFTFNYYFVGLEAQDPNFEDHWAFSFGPKVRPNWSTPAGPKTGPKQVCHQGPKRSPAGFLLHRPVSASPAVATPQEQLVHVPHTRTKRQPLLSFMPGCLWPFLVHPHCPTSSLQDKPARELSA